MTNCRLLRRDRLALRLVQEGLGYLHAILSARETILIANAYFVPDRGLIRALRRAALRGVRVAILVPSESDVQMVQKASEHLFDRLFRRGVEIYQWRETHMRAKTAVVDGVWSVVGSYNLDSVSLFQNNELVIESVGPSFGAWMNEQFAQDQRASHRVTVVEWRRRPSRRRLVEWLVYRIRRWLLPAEMGGASKTGPVGWGAAARCEPRPDARARGATAADRRVGQVRRRFSGSRGMAPPRGTRLSSHRRAT